MKLLTPERFHERHAELVELRDKADGDYRRANLEAAMGTGTDSEVLKAKQSLDLINGQLDGLEAARVESNRIKAQETRAARQGAHAKLVEDAERLLTEREATIARIEAMARDLHGEIGKFDALTSGIGSAVKVYQPHVSGPATNAGHVTRGRMATLSGAAVWNYSLPSMVTAIVRGDHHALGDMTLIGTEAAVARAVRFQIEQVAPEREMA